MQVRFARQSRDLDAVVSFYRDGLGLPEIGGFSDHEGFDGVMLGLPGSNAHLEFTAGAGSTLPEPHEESLLVLYLGDAATVQATLERSGAAPVASVNPYWDRHGVTVGDPDGFRVVLVAGSWTEAGLTT